MGNEISTAGGAVATAATGIAVGVTFGQVEAVNNSCKQSAKYTADKASKTIVRHTAETVGSAAVFVGTSIAAEVVSVVDPDLAKSLEKEKMLALDNTLKAGAETCIGVGQTVYDVANNVPVVGHVKGAVHYVCGDKEGGDKAMKSASRTTGVVLGGVAGIAAGPAGMVAGGIAGGAAVDGITTGVESGIKGEYTPSGQFEIWTRVAQAENPEELTEGIMDGITTTVTDGLTGYAAGKAIKKGSKTLSASKKKLPRKYGGKGSSGSENVPLQQKLPRGRFNTLGGTEYIHTLEIFPFRPDPVQAGLKRGGLI